jgi:hypothetical protein
MNASLPTGLWVQAHVARFSSQGVPVVVVRRGDPHRGVVMVKQHLLGEGFRVVSQVRDLDGALTWETVVGPEPVPESDADNYIARQTGYDPDLWVIEIELRPGSEDIFQGPVV